MTRTERIRLLKRAVLKARRRLERSLAHIPEPYPRDLERWASWRAEIDHLETTLAAVLAGENPPGSRRLGEKTRELPDAV